MSLFKSTAIYTIGNIFTRAISFILLPLYSNLIPPDEFGIYILIISAYAVAGVFYQGGFQAAFTKFYLDAESFSTQRKIFSNVFSLIILISFILTIVFSLYSNFLSSLITGNSLHSNLITLASWMLFFDTTFFYILHLFKTEQKAKQSSLYTIINGVINFSLNILLVYFLHKGISGILISQLVASIISVLLLYRIVKLNLILNFDIILLKKVVLFSLPLLAAGIFSTLVDFADRFILDHYMDKSTVGIYSFAYRIALVMNLFVISFRTAWTPHAIILYKQNLHKEIFGKTLLKLITSLCLIFLIIGLLIDDLFRIELFGINIFNMEYFPGIDIIPYVLLAYAFNALISFYSIYPFVIGKSSYFLYSDIIAFSVNILLNLLLIPLFGMKGAAYATMISYLASLIFLFVISRIIEYKSYKKEISFIVLFTALIFFFLNLQKNIFYDLSGIVIFMFFSYLLLKSKIKIQSFFFNKV